jgi:hypothetical protein
MIKVCRFKDCKKKARVFDKVRSIGFCCGEHQARYWESLAEGIRESDRCADTDKMVRDGVKGVIDSALRMNPIPKNIPISPAVRLKEYERTLKFLEPMGMEYLIQSSNIEVVKEDLSWFRLKLEEMKNTFAIYPFDEVQMACIVHRIDKLLKECEVDNK